MFYLYIYSIIQMSIFAILEGFLKSIKIIHIDLITKDTPLFHFLHAELKHYQISKDFSKIVSKTYHNI